MNIFLLLLGLFMVAGSIVFPLVTLHTKESLIKPVHDTRNRLLAIPFGVIGITLIVIVFTVLGGIS